MPSRKNGTGKGDESDELGRLAEVLASGDAGAGEEGQCEVSGTDAFELAENIARLRACAGRLAKAHTFVPGQLVRWKQGLRNRGTPAYGEPVVVMRQLNEPLFEEVENSGNPCFREPLTLVAAEVDDEGDFLCYHYDARRLEPYEGA